MRPLFQNKILQYESLTLDFLGVKKRNVLYWLNKPGNARNVRLERCAAGIIVLHQVKRYCQLEQ